MSEAKKHQGNTTEWQIRIDGKPVYYPHTLCNESLNTWAKLCRDNPDCYVDIVKVSTQIVLSQCEYYAMERHFDI